jgi:hypothetical protein
VSYRGRRGRDEPPPQDGEVVPFPGNDRPIRLERLESGENATIIVLPVIKVERRQNDD